MKRERGILGVLGVVGAVVLAAGCVGGADEATEDDGVGAFQGEASEYVRISDRFTIDIPADDVWAAGLIDQDTTRPGLQVQVEVHRFTTPGQRWVDRNNEPWERYTVVTTGHEHPRGITRTLATSVPGQFHAIDAAFVLNHRLHLVGESTGGQGRLGHRRNPKKAVIAINFNGVRATERLGPVALVVPVDDPVNGRILVDVPAGEGFPSDTDQDPGRPGFQAYGWIDQVSFSTRWSTGEAFACYNLVTTGAERRDGRSSFLGGSTPDQFRATEGAFGLDGVAYVLGERTGGARGNVAAAPHRALLFVQFDGRSNGNNPVNTAIDVHTLPH